ncbi:flagellar hook assembly protein FlgD [Pantoea allii]|uniref:flagellar hook assembly protein FlgD n=1 Tax=Pantoea TaxID=53335 RepID=UPI0007C74382|nr:MULTISPECIES: flagellar hook assembly protein FlgD [Pantoea]MBW1252884.1 flagellar hook assembly protein FlgD [Pantoea allii]MBW1262338.1 flagellar hook assembly protein FlgD [Pantoea allii]MBW1283467.1 flagellar hook assembly protein FlgD [Pantoea allii]OAE08570.1 flagellar basal body rod modification protein [Pantoea sp. OXWO6B1]ORM87240.1 flagellar basal body rod modification protein [Pantoea allii]
MSVNGVSTQSVTTAYGSSSSVSANDNSAAGMNSLFLQLLVAQIQNQDPLNPTDGTEYVGQLAQLTQVQSMETLTQLMANNSVLMDNLQTLTTGNLVGQQVMVQTDTINSDGVTTLEGRFTLDHAANSVTVILKDETGKETEIELGRQEVGDVNFNINPQALGLSEGKYSISLMTDAEKSHVPVEIGGRVSNVRIPLDGSATVLNIIGLGEVAYNKITQFGQPDD